MVTSKPTTSTTTVSPTPQQIAEGKARAGGQTATSEQLVDKVSPQAKQAGGTVDKTKNQTGPTGLLGVPKGTEVVVSTTSAPPTTAGGKPVIVPVTKTVQYVKGDGYKHFLTLTNAEKAELLSKLSYIPGVYPKGQAPTQEFIDQMLAGRQVAIRDVDATALEEVMKYADTVGESVTISVEKLYNNPDTAQRFFNIKSTLPKVAKVTPAAALNAEVDAAFQDYFDMPIDKATAKKYADAVNAAEKKRGGAITSLERNNILLDFVQKKAADIYKESVDSQDSTLLEQGALGRTFQQIRKAYDNYGVPVTDKQLSKLAVTGIRSKQALDNVLNKIQFQAEAAFPALKEYLKQGLSTRDALATHIGMYSQVYGVPENQVKISDLYDAFDGDKLKTPSQWKTTLYSMPKFKNTDLYQQQLSSDANALLRNFIG